MSGRGKRESKEDRKKKKKKNVYTIYRRTPSSFWDLRGSPHCVRAFIRIGSVMSADITEFPGRSTLEA